MIPVLVVSSLGAVKNYPDREMLKRTLGAFLHSLRRQAGGPPMLFLSGHDRPDFLQDEAWIRFHSIGDGETTANMIPAGMPKKPGDQVVYRDVPFLGKMADMSRKTYDAVIQAGEYARRKGINRFWMLRMDSDDLLWQWMIDFLGRIDPRKACAVYNRCCHMVDPRSGELAEHYYPYSTTCNALYYEFDEAGFLHPDWFYHCRDHTTFMRTVREDGFRSVEVDHTFCITTNSGNSISGRPEIDKEKNVRRIPVTPDLVDRYGLDAYLSRT